MARSTVKAESSRTPFGIELAAGMGVMVVSVAVAQAVFASAPARLLVVVLAAGGFAATADDLRAGLAVGGLGYLLFDGFLVNQYGELTWDGTTSMWYLMALAAAMAVGHAWRWVRRLHHQAAIDAALADLLKHTVSTAKENHGDRPGVRAADGGPVRAARPGSAGGGAAVNTPRRLLNRSRGDGV